MNLKELLLKINIRLQEIKTRKAADVFQDARDIYVLKYYLSELANWDLNDNIPDEDAEDFGVTLINVQNRLGRLEKKSPNFDLAGRIQEINEYLTKDTTKWLYDAIEVNDEALFDAALNCGARVGIVYLDYTALHHAAMFNRIRMAEKLIRAGANVNHTIFAIGGNTETPLFIAVQNNHIEMTRFLLGHGADADFLINKDVSILQFAATDFHVSAAVFAELLKNSVNPDTKHLLSAALRYVDDLLPIDSPRFINSKNKVEKILARSKSSHDAEEFNIAVRKGVRAVQLMQLAGYACTEVSLAEAIFNSTPPVVDLLLKEFPLNKVKEKSLDKTEGLKKLANIKVTRGFKAILQWQGYSTLMFFAAIGSGDGIRFYLKKLASAEKNAQKIEPQKNKNMALLVAAKFGRIEIITELLNAGAEVNHACENKPDLPKIDEVGNTPLMLAAKYGHVNAVNLLLSKGANRDLAISTSAGSKMAVDFARENKHYNVVAILSPTQKVIRSNSVINRIETIMNFFSPKKNSEDASQKATGNPSIEKKEEAVVEEACSPSLVSESKPLENMTDNKISVAQSLSDELQALTGQVKKEITRLRENGKHWYGIGNNKKADAIESALATASGEALRAGATMAGFMSLGGTEKSIFAALSKHRITFLGRSLSCHAPRSAEHIEKFISNYKSNK